MGIMPQACLDVLMAQSGEAGQLWGHMVVAAGHPATARSCVVVPLLHRKLTVSHTFLIGECMWNAYIARQCCNPG